MNTFLQLYDRKMTCRLDKQPGLTPEEQAQLPSRLPEGLGSVGMGLGSNGNPLTEVAKNLANQQVNDHQLDTFCCQHNKISVLIRNCSF